MLVPSLNTKEVYNLLTSRVVRIEIEHLVYLLFRVEVFRSGGLLIVALHTFTKIYSSTCSVGLRDKHSIPS